MSKHLLALALLVALAVVLAGCSSESQTETGDSAAIISTINGYIDAYNARDYQKCLTYLTGWDPASSEEDRTSMVRLARGFSGQMTIEKIEDITVSGSTATAMVTRSWENPDADGKRTNAPGEQVDLKKDGGTWKLQTGDM